MDALCIVAHGSRIESANQGLQLLKESFENSLSIPIYLGYSDKSKDQQHLRSICQTMQEEGMNSIGILPLYMTQGHIYTRAMEIIRSYDFTLTEYPTLLSDIESVSSAIPYWIDYQPDTYYLLVAHNSTQQNQVLFDRLQERINKDNIKIVVLDHNTDFQTWCPDTDYPIEIIPFMMVNGHHVEKDLKMELLPLFKSKGYRVQLQSIGLPSRKAFRDWMVQYVKGQGENNV